MLLTIEKRQYESYIINPRYGKVKTNQKSKDDGSDPR